MNSFRQMLVAHHTIFYDSFSCINCRAGEYAIAFMHNFVNVMGDRNPEANRILLPVGITVHDIYMAYRKGRDTTEQLKKSQFYGLWKCHFGHVSYQKVMSEMFHRC